MHLLSFRDFVRGPKESGTYVAPASFYVDDASDTVPRDSLLETFKELGVSCHGSRYLRTWLRDRAFEFRLRTPHGRYLSCHRGVSRMLPREGALAPFMWLVRVDGFFQEIAAAGLGGVGGPKELFLRSILSG